MKTKHHSILSAPVTQSGDQILNNTIRSRWSPLALAGFLFSSVFALLPSSVQADCSQWDVSGKWSMQSTAGVVIELDLSQSGTEVTGKAKQAGATCTVKGTIVGNDFNFEMTLSAMANKTLAYSGKVGPQGRIELIGGPTTGPGPWHGTRAMKCAEASPATKPTGADQSSSSDTEDQHKKNKKKNKHHHHHDDDDQNQGND